jgi:hypothetical protein
MKPKRKRPKWVPLMPLNEARDQATFQAFLLAEIGRNLGLPRDFVDEPNTQVWAPWSTSAPAPIPRQPVSLTYPGIRQSRRVVLELGFRGYGLGAEMVDPTGDLLGLIEPGTRRFDPVPGAWEETMTLGLALSRLQAVGAKFDLIVADLTEMPDRLPAVGAFAPKQEAPSGIGRRLLADSAPSRKPEAPTINSVEAVSRALDLLLSPEGEALLMRPWTAGRERHPRTWRIHLDDMGRWETHYIRMWGAGNVIPIINHVAPHVSGVDGHLRCWTRGQTAAFKNALRASGTKGTKTVPLPTIGRRLA